MSFNHLQSSPRCCHSVNKLCLTLWLHGLHHARLLCPPLSFGVCSNSCRSSRWCYLTISSSAGPFSFHLQSFPASGSFPVSRLFASGGQSIGASASATVFSVDIQGWFPLGSNSLSQLKVLHVRTNIKYPMCRNQDLAQPNKEIIW